MTHSLLGHIFGTLYRHQGIFCTLRHQWADKYQGGLAHGDSEKGQEQQETEQVRRRQLSNHQTSTCKKKKEIKARKKFLGQSATSSHHLKNLVCPGLWLI